MSSSSPRQASRTQGCTQNPPPATGDRGWDNVVTIASPAWFDQYVVAVSATDSAGTPLTGQKSSLHGPWVDLAAPGDNIVGLSTSGNVINASIDDDQFKPIAGSSFAAAYVSGVAALVRAKFPQMPATEVIHRLTAPRTPRPVDVTTSSATASSTRWRR